MSAYIVENGTIQRALYALQSLRRPFYGKDLTKDEDLAELGQELYRLNTKAVNARYRSRTTGSEVRARTRRSNNVGHAALQIPLLPHLPMLGRQGRQNLPIQGTVASKG
jgi:hypothetical protein